MIVRSKVLILKWLIGSITSKIVIDPKAGGEIGLEGIHFLPRPQSDCLARNGITNGVGVAEYWPVLNHPAEERSYRNRDVDAAINITAKDMAS